MNIAGIDVLCESFSRGTWLDESRVSTPLSHSNRFGERRSSWRGPGADLVWVRVRTDDPAVFGVGQARGGAVAASLLTEHLAPLVVGRELCGIESTVRELRLAALPYADGQLLAMACAAVELALWDALARECEVPLVTLLGGAAADPLRYYLTAPDASALAAVDPQVIARAEAIKVPARYGPADGSAGIARMIADLDEARSALPASVPLAIDCFMSWDVAYTRRFAHAARDLGLAWIEEPVLPDDIEGYRELRASLGPVAVAGGEHLSSLRAALRFVDERCVDLVQPDVTWCGGLSVAQTIGRVAVAHGLGFAPHGGALHPWAVHLVASFGTAALLEVILGVDGRVEVPTPGTGLGVGIDPEAVGFA